VLRIIVDGAGFHDVVQYASEKGWAVGERQLWNYVAKANDLLAKRMERDRDKLLARHISQRRNLYARALNAADYRTALAVVDSEAKLCALFPNEKLDVNLDQLALAELQRLAKGFAASRVGEDEPEAEDGVHRAVEEDSDPNPGPAAPAPGQDQAGTGEVPG
jgi:hypothetical protein